MIPRTPKQKLLSVLSNADLRNLVDRFNLGDEIKKGQSRDSLLRDLSRLKRVTVEQVVEGLSLESLRAACRNLGLDDSGRQGQLAQLILARFGKSPSRIQRSLSAEEERPLEGASSASG
ncbi:MAG: hypothetical protein RMK29_09175 [Myxococcales bacterium]|nr:hypothetical protein [Myxococcota bacterium]MDW8281870.1 hypothetical protein [Myxococcales bacterium]